MQSTRLDNIIQWSLREPFCFWEVDTNSPLTRFKRCTYQNLFAFSICFIGNIRQFVCVQLYMVLGRVALATENVDYIMERIFLHWYKHQEYEGCNGGVGPLYLTSGRCNGFQHRSEADWTTFNHISTQRISKTNTNWFGRITRMPSIVKYGRRKNSFGQQLSIRKFVLFIDGQAPACDPFLR